MFAFGFVGRLGFGDPMEFLTKSLTESITCLGESVTGKCYWFHACVGLARHILPRISVRREAHAARKPYNNTFIRQLQPTS